MMLRWVVLALALLVGSAQAQMGSFFPGPGTAHTSGCTDSNASAWAAAVVTAGGTVSGAQATRVCTLIQAYKSAGVWTLLDHEWLYASENATQASIDIVGLAVHTLVNNGSGTPIFTANQGYDGSNFGSIDLGFPPSAATNFQLNANSFGAYLRTSRTTGNAGAVMGTTSSGATISFFRALNGSSNIEYDDNGATFPTVSNTNAQGNYIFSRTNSSTIVPYRNASTLSSGSSSTGGLSTQNWYVFGYNNNGSLNSADTVDQIASVFTGGSLDSVKAPAKNAALNNYMTAIGANVY